MRRLLRLGLVGSALLLGGCPKDKKKPKKGGDDGGNGTLHFTIGNVTVDEASGPARVKVALNKAAASPVSVVYETSDGSAEEGSDYTGVAGATLEIPAGKTQGTISIPIVDDPAVEGDETFHVTLTDASAGTIDIATATVTIVDDASGTGGGGEGGDTGQGGAGAAGGEGGSPSGGSVGTGGSTGTGGSAGSGGKGGSAGTGGTGGGAPLGRTYVYTVNTSSRLPQVFVWDQQASNTEHKINILPPAGDPATNQMRPYGTVASRDGKKLAIFALESDENLVELNYVVYLGDAELAYPPSPNPATTATFATVKIPYSDVSFTFPGATYYTDSRDLGAWSPDNQHFYFLPGPRDTIAAEKSFLYVVDEDGQNLEQILPEANTYVSTPYRNVFWTPDSEGIVLTRVHVEPGPVTTPWASAWTRSGGFQTYLPSAGVTGIFATGMSPRPGTGKGFAFAQDGKVYVGTADSANAMQISDDMETASNPVWSPDGKHLAFSAIAVGGTANDIWIVDATGGHRAQVTFGGSSAARVFAFSPNSALLAYTSDEASPGQPRLYQISATAPAVSNRVQLSVTSTGAATTTDFAPLWSPDGAYVAYGFRVTRGLRQIQIAEANTAMSGIDASPADHDVLVEGAPIPRMWPDVIRPLPPSWSRTGNLLAFVAADNDYVLESVWRVAADGTGLVPMVVDEGFLDPRPVVNFGWTNQSTLVTHTIISGDSIVFDIRSNELPQANWIDGRKFMDTGRGTYWVDIVPTLTR